MAHLHICSLKMYLFHSNKTQNNSKGLKTCAQSYYCYLLLPLHYHPVLLSTMYNNDKFPWHPVYFKPLTIKHLFIRLILNVVASMGYSVFPPFISSTFLWISAAKQNIGICNLDLRKYSLHFSFLNLQAVIVLTVPTLDVPNSYPLITCYTHPLSPFNML